MTFNSQRRLSNSQTARPNLLEIVMQALEATGRVPAKQPATNFPRHFTADRIDDFYVEPLGNGWVSTITFRDVPAGEQNCLGSPDAFPYDDPRKAFLHGATILCEIATGSRELPFTMVGDKLIVAAYQP
ncbi:hypothetical protein [Thioclava sp. F28-4]|uniref:hypothetical protein n=1 Tax=Thioclava sp. F28-4 TaxID=1915315 RepID=UPI0009976738|nr:hypothetical protein [Thioclava sp. F28-4]OOY02793.1 hypothetical protein BMI87_21105 [Thioclava sp. F28-4]